MMKNKKTWIYGLLTILIGIIIFCFSAQPADESSQMSGFVVQLIQTIFGEGVFGEYLHFLVRKAAHVTVYFLFGLSATCFWTSCLIWDADNCIFDTVDRLFKGFMAKKRMLTVSVLFGLMTSFLYACSDEWHQTFVVGRSGSFRDVLVDGIGFVIAAFIVWLMGRKSLKATENML